MITQPIKVTHMVTANGHYINAECGTKSTSIRTENGKSDEIKAYALTQLRNAQQARLRAEFAMAIADQMDESAQQTHTAKERVS